MKLIEKDALMAARLQIPADKDETFREHIISIMEQESGLDAEAAMAKCGFHSSRDSAGKRLSVRMKASNIAAAAGASTGYLPAITQPFPVLWLSWGSFSR